VLTLERNTPSGARLDFIVAYKVMKAAWTTKWPHGITLIGSVEACATEAGRHTLLFFRRHTAQATRTCSRLASSFGPCGLGGVGGGGGDDGLLSFALGESIATQSR
jgi:hypothetical protein